MNTRLLPTVLAATCFLVACNKSPNITSDSPNVQAQPFHGQVYRSFDGRTTLTLISRDECELNEGGTTLLCKYIKQSDALRVVLTTMGTNQVVYYRVTDQGIQDNHGNLLLSPDRYAAAMEQGRIEQERQERMRREEVERRLAEENRKRAAVEEQKVQFISWLHSYFAKGQQHDGEKVGGYHQGDAPYLFTVTMTAEPEIAVIGKDVKFKAFASLHWHGKFDNGMGSGAPNYYKDNDRVVIKGEGFSISEPPFEGTILFTYRGTDGQEYMFDSSNIRGRAFTRSGFALSPVTEEK